MSETSVRPDNLQQFVEDSQRIEQHLIERINTLGANHRAFQATSGIAVGNGDLFANAIPGLVGRLEGTRTFTELVRTAVLAADVGGDGGVVTLSSAQFDAVLTQVALQAGVDLDTLMGPQSPIEIDPPTVGAIPQSSGYVDDPVCTATGHFLEDEIDLAVPDRLAHLAWPRRYSSRLLDAGAHGRGWWSWADASCRVVTVHPAPGAAGGDGERAGAEGSGVEEVVLTAPDGRRISFVLEPGATSAGTDGAYATLHRDGAGLRVEWGRRSADGPETWIFDADGRPTRAGGPLRGTTTFTHDAGGRLVRVEHESGRHVTVEWEGERIAGLVDDAGRRVTYRYSSLGDLVAVERADGGRTYAPDEHGRITEVVDADGVALATNRYDEQGRVVRQIAPTGRVTLFRYEPGRRTSVLDGQGALVALYVHDRLGRVEVFATPAGAGLQRRFDADGCVVEQHAHDGTSFVAEGSSGPGGTLRVVHGDGRHETFRYDERGRLAEHQRGDDEPLRYRYDGDHVLPARVDGPEGWSVALDWAPSGALLGVTDADGVRATFEPDDVGLVAAVADGRGRTTRIARHPAGPATRVELPDGGVVLADIDDAGRPTRVVDPEGGIVALRYSPGGRLTAIDDERGGRTELGYGPDGALAWTRTPDGVERQVQVDGWGRPTTITDGTGHAWAITYDTLGRVATLTLPSGATWARHLDALARPAGVTDPSGRRTELAHDDVGRLHRAAGPLLEVELVHDATGRVAARHQVPGGRTELAHDEADRLVERTDADGVVTAQRWTPGGRLAAAVGPLTTVELAYDAAGQLAEVARAGDLRRWRFERDWRGDPVAVTSPEGRTTTIERDRLGRPVRVDRAGVVDTRAYGDGGRLSATTTPSGATTRFEHDPAGRLTAVDAPGGGRSTFGYGPTGRVATETDPLGGTTRFEHDPDGRLVARTDALGRTTRHLLDASGVPTGVDLADGSQLRYELDPSSRVRAVHQDGEVLARYAYGPDGLLAEVVEPGHRPERFRYSAAGRVTAWGGEGQEVEVDRDEGLVTARRGPGLPAARWRHHPDGVEGEVDGRRVRMEADADGATSLVELGEHRLLVERDATGRVVALRHAAGGPSGPEQVTRLERDGAGRVVAEVDTDGATTRYGYDDADRLASVTGPAGTCAFRYDAAGRLVEEHGPDGTRRYRYDAAHQLEAVEEPDGTATTYGYDACGRRVLERRGDHERRYEWDALGRLTAVVDDGTRVDVHVDVLGLLRRVGASEVRWDHSGPVPVPAAVDGRALVTLGRRILGDGDELRPTALLGGSGASPWGHAGPEAEVQTDVGLPGGLGFCGLIWLGARVYDPATRQFLTPDPLPGVPGTSVLANPYHYAGQDPVNAWDPTGLAGRPISIDDFNDMREEATSVQWQNIATVGLAVAGAVVMGALMVSGVGLVGLAVAGAAIGGVSAAVPAAIEGKGPGEVARQFAVGALVGGATTVVGGALFPGGPASLAAGLRAGVREGVVVGAPGAFVQEGLDSFAGGDGRFDLDAAAGGAVLNVAGSTVTGGIASRAPGAPDVVAAPDPVPSPLHVVDSVPEGWVQTPSGIAHPAPGLVTPSPSLTLPQPGFQTPAPPTGWVETESGLLIPGR